VDPLWHVNNVRMMEYYQETRVLFHRALRDEFDLERQPGSRTLVAHQSVDYLLEVKYPDRIRMGIGVLRIGITSYSLGMAMFQNDRGTGLATTVVVHANDSGPAPLPTAFASVLRRNLLPEDAR
jgi:acyl-CoA thioester hydrolase